MCIRKIDFKVLSKPVKANMNCEFPFTKIILFLSLKRKCNWSLWSILKLWKKQDVHVKFTNDIKFYNSIIRKIWYWTDICVHVLLIKNSLDIYSFQKFCHVEKTFLFLSFFYFLTHFSERAYDLGEKKVLGSHSGFDFYKLYDLGQIANFFADNFSYMIELLRYSHYTMMYL